MFPHSFPDSLLRTLGATIVITASARGATPALSFNRDIRPILAENCMSCHGPDPGSRKAGLRLDTEAGLFEKRKDSPAPVVKGNAKDSELFKRLLSTDPDEVMPPPESHKKLKPAEIALLQRWINEGATWQPHWSFIPPEKAPLPGVKNKSWPKNAIDHFVLAKLESIGLEPAPEAAPHTLFRRIHLDITGLPPSPADLDVFTREYATRPEETLSKWIDRLMHTPAWGEHRARYWLDAARYGDTHGLHFDNYREMWPYRDWVIRSFNSNQPFGDFTREQIAGDLFPSPTTDQLIATGFQRCNITTAEGGTIAEENLANYAADRVQTIGWVYLGLTTNCAQCHDHKFDAFTMRDYYSLAAFFRNTTQGGSDGNSKDGRSAVIVIPDEKDAPRWQVLGSEIEEAKSKRTKRGSAAAAEFKSWMHALTPENAHDSVPADALVVSAPLNEGAGSAGKISPAGPDAYHAAAGLEWMEGGKFGKFLKLKKGASITIGDFGDFGLKQPFSVGAWVFVPKAAGNGRLLGRVDAKEGARGWSLRVSGRALNMRIVDNSAKASVSVNTQRVLKEGAWQHVAVTYDGSGKAAGIRIYVDAKEEKSTAAADSLRADSEVRAKAPLVIGSPSNSDQIEDGALQDLRLYSRMLSPEEIRSVSAYALLRETAELPLEKRTGARVNELRDYYLTTLDSEYRALHSLVATLEAEKEEIKARSAISHVQEELKSQMPMANILLRGQYNKVGESVKAAPPAALHAMPQNAPANRLGLAQWLTDEGNPLTPRVTVNRFWQEVFGQGIVRTSEDFGIMGAAPSNQDLLDWVAAEFRESGGDVQKLFKLFLTSATYRQSAVTTAAKLEKDPDNALLSRGPRYRMDAEMIRDYALAASGLLSKKMFGPGLKPYQPESIWDVVGVPGGNTRNYVQDKGESLYRRTVYHFWKRMAHPPNLEIFNAPSREQSCVRRERTNTPLQALVTLNDPQFVEAARKLAENAVKEAGSDSEKAFQYILRHALGRSASKEETRILESSLKGFTAHYTQQPEQAAALLKVGETPCPDSVPAPTLAAWTMVCNQVLNLDETLNK